MFFFLFFFIFLCYEVETVYALSSSSETNGGSKTKPHNFSRQKTILSWSKSKFKREDEKEARVRSIIILPYNGKLSNS